MGDATSKTGLRMRIVMRIAAWISVKETPWLERNPWFPQIPILGWAHVTQCVKDRFVREIGRKPSAYDWAALLMIGLLHLHDDSPEPCGTFFDRGAAHCEADAAAQRS